MLRIDGEPRGRGDDARGAAAGAGGHVLPDAGGRARVARAVASCCPGTGPNGSNGLKRVKEYGGLVVVQDPDEAEYGDMPRNAIATGLVDLVLPVADMPERIRDFREQLRADGRRVPSRRPRVTEDPEALREILTLLRVRTGHDFSNYKPATVLRRVERRIDLRSLPTTRRLRRVHARAAGGSRGADEGAADQRHQLLPRPGAFDGARAAQSFRGCSTDKRRSDQVRVWVPACATGEEAYSIAMLLAEHAERRSEQPASRCSPPISTSRRSPARAKASTPNADVADVSEERLQRFFERERAATACGASCARWCCSRTHNVIRDPPFSHLDLISCRNLLIYLNRSVQERLIETFHFALRPGRLPVSRRVGVAGRPRRPVRVVRQGRAHLREPRGRRAG